MRINHSLYNIHYSLVAIVLAMLSSCSKEEISTYDTSHTSLNIWVGNVAGAVFETTTYNYSYAYEEGAVTFYAQISGMPADHDRTFHLQPFGGDSALMVNTIRSPQETQAEIAKIVGGE